MAGALAEAIQSLTTHIRLPDNVPESLKLGIYVVIGLHLLAVAFWVFAAASPKAEPYYVKKARLQAKEGLGDKNA